MDISIIIGLLVALVIICATTVVNNLINKEYRSLNDKWKNRTSIISSFIFHIGRLDKNIKTLVNSGKLDNDSRQELMEILSSIESIKFTIKDYEQDNF